MNWVIAAEISVALALVGMASAAPVDDFAAARDRMVRDDIAAGGVTDLRVLESMRATPRHEFLPASQRPFAYFDMALPIGESQTISGPFVVASMTASLEPKPGDRVLEIGTGSGYQAAVLAPLVKTVYSIEIKEPLAVKAARTLKRLGYTNVITRTGDGFQGWPEHAPFDGIIVTCSPEDVPQPLLDQLAEGGRMMIPVGERFDQKLVRITKRAGALVRETLEPTLFVPMTGTAEASRRVLPDGRRPVVRNGGFEAMAEDAAQPAAWYYGRQFKIAQGGAGDRGQYLRLHNTEPGRPAQIFQGFAVDGRAVGRLRVRLMLRGEDVAAGRSDDEQPLVLFKFLDEHRKRSAVATMGPWSGTFAWRPVDEVVSVPIWAREASLMVGMGGATGELDADEITVEGLPR